MYSTKQTSKLLPQQPLGHANSSSNAAPGSQNTVNINMNITNIGMPGVQPGLINPGHIQVKQHKRSNSQVQKKPEAAGGGAAELAQAKIAEKPMKSNSR